MRVTPLALQTVLLIEPTVFRDSRGAFAETWNARDFAAAGIDVNFVQENVSVSRCHTLRGLHYQVKQPQGKLLRVLNGEIFDAVVDLRRSSDTFGQSVTLRLAANDGQSLWVPDGFAHGFLALADDTRVQYKVTDYWAPQCERTLAWNDPALGIHWPLPVGAEPLLSDKDRAGQSLAAADVYP